MYIYIIINYIYIPIICIMICYFINNIVNYVMIYVHATAVKLWQVLANLVMEWLSLVRPRPAAGIPRGACTGCRECQLWQFLS